MSGLFQYTAFTWRCVCSFCHPLYICVNLDILWASGRVRGLQMLGGSRVSWWIFQIVRFYWMYCNIYCAVLPSYNHCCSFGGRKSISLVKYFPLWQILGCWTCLVGTETVSLNDGQVRYNFSVSNFPGINQNNNYFT